MPAFSSTPKFKDRSFIDNEMETFALGLIIAVALAFAKRDHGLVTTPVVDVFFYGFDFCFGTILVRHMYIKIN